MPRLATAVTVDFARLAAVDGYVTSLATPERKVKQLSQERSENVSALKD